MVEFICGAVAGYFISRISNGDNGKSDYVNIETKKQYQNCGNDIRKCENKFCKYYSRTQKGCTHYNDNYY